MVTGAGAVTLILESRRSATARGVVTATAAASGVGALRSVVRRLGRATRPPAADVAWFSVGPMIAIAAALGRVEPTTVVAAGHDATAAGVAARGLPPPA